MSKLFTWLRRMRESVTRVFVRLHAYDEDINAMAMKAVGEWPERPASCSAVLEGRRHRYLVHGVLDV